MDDRLATIRRLVTAEHEALTREHPALSDEGGTLLLGRHYAYEKRGIVMLGINPGANVHDRSLYVGTYDSNCLLPGSPDEGFSYWRNAQILFGSTPELRSAMETATFAFCCPFRTKMWSGLPRVEREALIAHSRPIIGQLLEDCDPQLVIVAGVAGLDALRNIAAPRLRIGELRDDGGAPTGTYQWRAYHATRDGADTTVAQVPHFSRANARQKLTACGHWLSDLARDTS